MPPEAYKIENLDVYRRTLAFCTGMYSASGRTADDNPEPNAVVSKIRETALALTLNLASGLGFWEKEWKAHHFLAAKKGLLELYPLLELWRALGGITEEQYTQFVAEQQEIARMVNGLLRQAKRKEA